MLRGGIFLGLGIIGLALRATGNEPAGFLFASIVFSVIGADEVAMTFVQRRRERLGRADDHHASRLTPASPL